ncbi:vacuolar protein sorting-associated protein [Chloropicon primus]|uniref:Vacuolar protein sorting-associated protein n=5 Tax=Chloropicon primus TaxID=1764295 RepID=A0A5B8MIK8_9CHLO|nr:vacuolar protein sorting-associated protein [Chloropicon primus]|eukprot:QDZ20283.1 vacuolar protein sorting-associated protein [Chloropicon primus]
MFESKLTALLEKYLGDYVCGLDKDALKVSVWSGNIVLKNLKLKPDALKFLGIPGLQVKSGLLGCLTLRIPWNKLGSEPVIVEFDRIYVLGSLDASGKGSLYEDPEEAMEASESAKRRRIEGAVAQMVATAERAASGSEGDDAADASGGYFNRIIQTVLGNLQVIITNLHVRLEDSYWGFAIDFTIEELSGVTVNEKGEPDFVSSGLNEQLRKRFKLRKLMLYIDSNSKEFTPESQWEDLNMLTWDNFFMPHIKGEDPELTKSLFLKPVNADLLYNRKHGKGETKESDEIVQTVNLTFEALALSALQSQYVTVQRMLQTFEVVSARAPYSHIRPHCTVKTSPRSWWLYALNALYSSGLVRKRTTFQHLVGWNGMRQGYVKAYTEHLGLESQEELSESMEGIKEMEDQFNEKTVVFFRCLAIAEHKRRVLERKKSSNSNQGSWFWGWGSAKKAEGAEDNEGEMNFDESDWQKLQSVYIQDDGTNPGENSGGLGSGDMYVEVNVASTSLQLYQNSEREILLGNINAVRVEANFKGGLAAITASVGSYLLESQGFEIMKNGAFSSDTKAFTLTVEQTAVQELNLTHIKVNIAPCFVQVYKPSIEDILIYFLTHDTGAAKLTTLGMQASAAAQELGKNTAEQLQVAIASRPSVTFSLDLQAPKVAIVWGEMPTAKTLVVNLGRIALSSEDSKDETVWQRMRAKLSDTEVYLADGELQWKSVDINRFKDCSSIDLPKSALLPKFGMEALFQYGDLSSNESQLSLDLHVPDFCLYFSPMVVCNAMNLAKYYMTLGTLFQSDENSWDNAELADYVQIAISSEVLGAQEMLSPRKGSKKPSLTMNWIHSCKIYLKDDVLYADIPGNVVSRSIFLGRASQILAVPSKLVDDRENVIIVTESQDRLKQALNMDCSIVMSFDNEEKKGLWLQNLQFRNEHLKGFVHRAPEFNEFLMDPSKPVEEPKSVRVHIHGKLDVFHLFVQGRAYNAAQEGYNIEPFFSFDTRKETELIKVNAKGVSLELSSSKDDMHVQALLSSLFVEDLLLGRDSKHCKYLIESESERLDDIQASPGKDAEELGMIDQEGDVFYDPDESSPSNTSPQQHQTPSSLATIKFNTFTDETEGTVSELDVDLSQISVFVNRPTVAALMVIGQDISFFLAEGSEVEESASTSDNVATEVLALDQDEAKEAASSTFIFKLQMKEAKFILNYASSDTPLALLKVESLGMSINLSGESFLLNASLGNLKVADYSVDSNHMYHWAVDVYEGESGSDSSSLVDLSLGSVKSDGSELCPDMFIEAHMNSISVVFLNRFLMEILLYIENLFKYQPELLGDVPSRPAVSPDAKPLLMQLNIALDAPMIKFPRSTSSTDYLEVTPGEVQVVNTFSIHKGGRDIYIDEMDILLTGLKCTAYMNYEKGRDDILDGSAIRVILSRPLNFSPSADNRVGVRVLSSALKGKLTKSEYHFVISVAGENFSEEMTFKPTVQLPLPKEETVIVDQDAAGLLRGVVVDVDLDAVDITLHKEDGMRSGLSRLQCKNLKTYILYDFADTSMDLTVHLPQLRVEDISGANAESHSVVLCSGSAASALTSADSADVPSLLYMNFRSKGFHSELDLELQEPRIFGETEFIMSILDFFVPTAIPEDVLQCTTIDDPEFEAGGDIYLSPVTRICAMGATSDTFVFDGSGFSLVFPEEVAESRKVPLIFVGPGKTLLIRNTVIVNFSQMSNYVELMANARIEFEEVTHEDAAGSMSRKGSQANLVEETDMKLSVKAHNFLLELRASANDTSLSAQGNVDASLHMAGKSQHLRSKVEDLCLFLQERPSMTVGSDHDAVSRREGSSSITLLQPCTLGVEFVVEETSDMVHVDVSNLSFQMSPMAIHFLLQLQEELVTSLGRAPPEKPAVEALSFNKILSYEMFPGTKLTFWRPICDSRYAGFGDCITFGEEPPEKSVSVVAKGYGMVKKPVSFESVFSDDAIQIWHPVAPRGYVSLGCLATKAGEAPDLEDVHCMHRSLCVPTLTEEYFSPVSSTFSIVNVRNDFGTFIFLSAEHECACLNALIPAEMIENDRAYLEPQDVPDGIGKVHQDIFMDRKLTRYERESNKPYLRYSVQFKRILQNRRGNYSFWRPVIPDDCYYLGDIGTKGLAPPDKVLCIHKSANDAIANPVKFSLVSMEGKISIWKPIAPQGYVSLGYVLSRGTEVPPIEATCCVKAIHARRPEVFDQVDLKFSEQTLYLFTFNGPEKSFVISSSKMLPDDSWVVDFKDSDHEEEDKSMVVTTKCGNISLTVSDSVQTPKFEVQLVDILVSMEGKKKKSNAMCTFGVSLSSYNSNLLSWEPILEKTEMILKIRMASSEFGSVSLPGALGIYLAPTSTIHCTIAHACLESMLSLLAEWSDMTRSGSLFMNQDLNCLNTTVTNETGSDFYFLLQYSNGTTKVEKVNSSLAKQDFLQPFNVPQHLRKKNTIDQENLYARVKIENLHGSLKDEPNMLYAIDAALEYNEQVLTSFIGSRLFQGFDDGSFDCNEVLLIPLPEAVKKLLANDELAEKDILNITLRIWKARRNIAETRKVVATVSYPILKESPHQVRQKDYPVPLTDRAQTSGKKLFISFGIDLPLKRVSTDTQNASSPETFIGATDKGPWIPLSKVKHVEVERNQRFLQMSSYGTISPLKVGAGDMIMESNLIAGRRLERFRSNVQVYNSSQTSFDVGVKKIIPTDLNVFEVEGDHDPVDGKYFVSVFENERFNVAEGWGVSLGKEKRGKYSTFYGKPLSSIEFPKLALPLGWEWCGEWMPRKVPYVDSNGWCYYKNFDNFQYPPPKSARSKGITDSVRSRCFIRYCKHTTLTDEEIAVISAENNSVIEIGTLKPRDQLVLPKKFCAVGSILELVWRPSDCLPGDPTKKIFNWSILVSARSENILSLGSMQETSQLMACAQNMIEDVDNENDPALFCISSEGIELSTYFDTVTDWKIAISPAISIENCTNVEAAVSVWEQQKAYRGMSSALKIKERIKPHTVLDELKVDPRKLLAMAFIPEGWEWTKGKDPMVLEDREMQDKDEPKSTRFTLTKDKSALTLHMTRTRVYPKFPYPFTVKIWSEHCIDNGTRVPVCFCIVPDSSEYEELSTSAIRVITADGSEIQKGHAQRQIVLPGKSELMSSLKGSGKSGFRIAVKDSCFSAQSIVLAPGGDVVLLKAYCPYSSLVYHVTLTVQMHALAPTTMVLCKPHVMCSNLTGKELFICTGKGRESASLHVEIDAREIEVHSADRDQMKMAVKIDGYLWSEFMEVRYPNGPNTNLILESDDLDCARILAIKTTMVSPGCLHVVFASFNRLEFMPPYSIVNFFSESIMCKKAYDPKASWVEIEPRASYVPSFTYKTDSGARASGIVSVEVKAKDAPARVYTLWTDSSEGKNFSMEQEDDESELHLDEKQSVKGRTRKLHPLPINSFPGECAASLVTSRQGVKLVLSQVFELKGNGARAKIYASPKHTEFKFEFCAEYIDVSIVNSLPREVALLTVKGINLSFCDGIGMNNEKVITSLHVQDIELDDMLSITPCPAAITCKKDSRMKPFLSLVLHQLKGSEKSLHVSYSELRVGRPIEVEIYEKFVWEILGFAQSISLDKLETRADAYADPNMQIDVLTVAGLHAHISFQTDAKSRPKNLNMVSKFGLNFANIEKLPISILKSWEIRNLKLKQSVFMRVLSSRISRDFSKQILPMLLSGISLNTVSNVTTGAISSIASAAATLSLDDKFENSRSRKTGPVDDLADGLVSGGESLAKGLVSGISGIFTKPIQGAKKEGAKGFAKGFAKGIIGVATKPLSGALDMVSKSVEGGLATIDGVKSIAEVTKTRLRYPRAFRGDKILRPYNAYTAQGQHMFRTSVMSANIEELELTSELNPFASDVYEHHEPLPSDRVLIITDQRVLSLILKRGRLEGAKIAWHAQFLDILSVEIVDSTSDNPRVLRVILSANMGKKFTFQSQKFQRDVHCFPKQNQARRLQEMIFKKRQEYQDALHKPDILLALPEAGEGEGEPDKAEAEMCKKNSNFELVWHSGNYASGNSSGVVSVWRARCPGGYYSLGDVVSYGTDPPPHHTLVGREGEYQGHSWLAKPLSFNLEWRDTKKGKSSPSAFWIPVPPEGYTALGCVVEVGNTEPSKDSIRCVKTELLYETTTYDSPAWSGIASDKERWPLTLWQVDNGLYTFLPRRSKVKVGLHGYDLMM